MPTVIIYKDLKGAVFTVVPTEKARAYFTLEQIARKDVPKGLPYYFVDSEDLPDGEFQEAYTIPDIVVPDGYGYEKQKFESITADQAIALMLRLV